jgi:bifunctional enzyme CysN/CysC
MVCWMHEEPMQIGKKYAIKHTTKKARCLIRSLQFRVDIETLERNTEADTLELNEIGRVTLMTTVPLAYDAYSRNRYTGSLVIVDEATNLTVGAGLICEPTKQPPLQAHDGYVI